MKLLTKIKNSLFVNIPLTFFIASFIVYALTSAGKTPYDYSTRLAEAFLSGKYYLTDNPPWLSELIPAGDNKFYVVYPPMPAILSIPLVGLLGKAFQQQYLAHVLGAGLVAIVVKISQIFTKDKSIHVWSGVLVGLGSIIWFLAANGSVWYLGQVSAAFFISWAILEALSRKRPWVVGIALGAAYLSRLHTILSLPLFLFLLMKGKKNKLKPFFQMTLFALPFALFDVWYNLIRYSVPWNNGYFLIPGTLDEPWFAKGIMHPSYIIEDIKVAFFSLPLFLPNKPFVQPSWAGLSIWITTPAFVYSLKNKLNEPLVALSWLSIFLIFLVVGAHGGTGFSQFGYRFAVDFYPFLILLTLKAVSKQKLRAIHWVLLALGIVVNLWGVLWINKFGWVSY